MEWYRGTCKTFIVKSSVIATAFCAVSWFTYLSVPDIAFTQPTSPTLRGASSAINLRLLEQKLEALDERVKLQLDPIRQQIKAIKNENPDAKTVHGQLLEVDAKLKETTRRLDQRIDTAQADLVARMNIYVWAGTALVIIIGSFGTWLGYRTIKEEASKWAVGVLEEQGQKAIDKFLADLETLARPMVNELEKLRDTHTNLTKQAEDLVKELESRTANQPLPPETRRELNEADQQIARTKPTSEYTAKDWFIRGYAAYENKDWDAAIFNYSEAIKVDPNYAIVYANRGTAFYERTRYDEAIADLNKAIELNPNDSAAYNNRGIAFSVQNHYDEAIADLNKAIELNPNDAKPYNNRAEIQIVTGKTEQALKSARDSLSHSTELKDRATSYYLMCITLAILGCDTAEADVAFDQAMAEPFERTFGLEAIEAWLETASLEASVKQYIIEKTEAFKAH